MSQGTNLSPAHLNIFKNAAKKGAPITKPSPHPFSMSAMNNPGVVLLNPCFSSSTKVLYTESGIAGTEEMKNSTAEKAIDCKICDRLE